MLPDHILKQFDEDLNKLKSRLVKMGDLAKSQVESAIRSLQSGDRDLATNVIERAEKVDRYDVKIERLGVRLLALHQPMALDLRLILSSLSVNKILERMSDYAVSIARCVLELRACEDIVDKTQLSLMGKIAQSMVSDSIDAFINADQKLARDVALRDLEVDRLYSENFDVLAEIMRYEQKYVQSGSRLLLVNKTLERLADQAQNITEEVVFLVDAKIVKHLMWGEEDPSTSTTKNNE